MTNKVFFYGTLMKGFERPGRAKVDQSLDSIGRGWITGSLYDLGIYPAAVPSAEGQIWGEVHDMCDPETVLRELDQLEGFRPDEPDTSLYTRSESAVTLEDGRVVDAWVYYYNAPLGRAQRIATGDYLDHLKIR